MKLTVKLLLLPAFLFLFTATSFAQKISFAMLKGTWEVKDSRDLRIFKENKLHFNSVDAHCYLKSSWTFDSDSTGYITIKKSDPCPEPQTAKFKFQLFESPGYGGPMYKMGVTFENGYTDKLSLITEDGEKKLKIGYNQALVESTATDNRVWIYFSLKKKG